MDVVVVSTQHESGPLTKMKLYTLVAALAVSLTTSAVAHIGDSEAQMKQRYGKPYSTVPWGWDGIVCRSYHYHGFDIQALLAEGHCQAEKIRKQDRSDFQGEELESLVKANLEPGESLGEGRKVGVQLFYVPGHNKTASYDMRKRELLVGFRSFLNSISRHFVAEQRPNTSGF